MFRSFAAQSYEERHDHDLMLTHLGCMFVPDLNVETCSGDAADI